MIYERNYEEKEIINDKKCANRVRAVMRCVWESPVLHLVQGPTSLGEEAPHSLCYDIKYFIQTILFCMLNCIFFIGLY